MASRDKQSAGQASTHPGGQTGSVSQNQQPGASAGPPKTKAQLQAIKDEETRQKNLAEMRNFMLGVAHHELDRLWIREEIVWKVVETELYRRELREELQVSTRQAVVDWTHSAAGLLVEYAHINQRCHHEQMQSIYPEPEEDVVVPLFTIASTSD